MAGKNISVERCFQDAEETGILDLCGRNLKEFPNISEDRELIDVIECDISRNRFNELPAMVCEFVMLERLNCHHNNIRYVPDSGRLTCLTWLNLGKNQLQSLPEHLCSLPLKVLIVSNNKLSSLPDDICLLKQIQYLNLSCNELTSLPDSIGELSTLKELNVRQNQLDALPDEMCKLNLVKLDLSANRITVIPTTFRFLTALTDLVLDDNPLQSPPAQLCTRGRGHIFKYLAMMAQTQDKGKEASRRYNLSQRNASSILTEANLLPGKRAEEKPMKRSASDEKYEERDSRTSGRGSLLRKELARTQLLLDEHHHFDHDGFDDFPDEKELPVNIPQRGEEDLKMREASRKLQAQREKQKENTRQKHTDDSRVHYSDRSPERRKGQNVSANAKSPTIVKVIENENKSSVVKKVEVSDNLSDLDNTSDEDGTGNQTAPFPGIHKRNKHATAVSAYSSVKPNFTVRRMYESAREEFEKIELLREAIESRLKVRLPDDIPACLADGTVLCHLINYIRKGTIPSIFVPTPNMPKLTMSKCLKNVDHFLAACMKLGVERDKLCNPTDIVQEKNPVNVWITVEALLKETRQR